MGINHPSYADCVDALSSSLAHLDSSVQTLDAGVSDFPRLVKTLKSVRHYELISQPTLAAAEASLRDEIGPYIALLLSRAQDQTHRLEARIESLREKSELQRDSISRSDSAATSAAPTTPPPPPGPVLSGNEKLRARAAWRRKEALRYGVQRLELEVKRTESELKRRLEC
ncbi:hypothetical protein CDD82_7693 [Ophiocordyceps australis]|uniref:DASH complex subunit SPC19 n=1 Tax=Ophiocordyceps australis TaxID=1399860 RepID=A0A2C5YPK3_9HYPO|nr:hypothetical protein CDD82_7693 [Ophiocordyceps australis]